MDKRTAAREAHNLERERTTAFFLARLATSEEARTRHLESADDALERLLAIRSEWPDLTLLDARRQA